MNTWRNILSALLWCKGDVLREKQQAEETYLAEKAKLDKALAMGLMPQTEYEVKLTIAKKEYDNFEEIRKVQ